MQAGLRPTQTDERDFNLGALINFPKLENLPNHYELPPLSIKNQIADNLDDFCGACAGTGMIEPKEETELYYPFLFAAAKHHAKDNPDTWGLQLRDVARALQKAGVPELTEIPDKVKQLSPKELRYLDNYPESLKMKALKHKQASYFNVQGPYDHFDTARAVSYYFRHKKQAILFGTKWSWPMSSEYLDGDIRGYGHALWYNGWEGDSAIVTQSAGKEAGVNGQHLMSRATFNASVERFGMFMIVDMTREDAEDLLEKNIKLSDNWVIDIIKRLYWGIKNILWLVRRRNKSWQV